jgi:plastocyanin
MSNKTLSIVIVIILIAAGIFLFMGRSVAPSDINYEDVQVTAPVQVENATSTDLNAISTEKEIKEFTVEASNFSFSPKTIRVKEGDTVRLILKNNMGTHDLKIDELGVMIPLIGAGKTSSVEFIASKSGTFEYYCSVGTHRQMGMVGSLIVE